jgi:hypothetical protein
MKYLKTLTLVAVAVMALMAVAGAATSSASVLKQRTSSGIDTIAIGTELELTLEKETSMFFEDAFGLTAMTCTGSIIKVKLERVTPTGQPKGKVSSFPLSPCGHTVDTEAGGELEIRNIAGTTNGTVFSSGLKIKTFNTLLNQNCIINTGAGTDIGTLTAASSPTGKATLDINGLMPMEGCSASNGRWTGKYELTKPVGLVVEAS